MIGILKVSELVGFSQRAELSSAAQVLDDEEDVVVLLAIKATVSGTAIFNIDAILPISSAAASANGTRRASLTIFANR